MVTLCGKHRGVSAVLLVMLVSTTTAAAPWHYDNDGTDWGINYPVCGTGNLQSPVDFNSIQVDGSLKPFDFSWLTAASFRVLNSGHTIQVDSYDTAPALTDPNTGYQYNLLQFHFHSPSEHMWGTSMRDMEVHLVHIRQGKNFSQITDGSDLLVIGVSFVESRLSNNNFLNTFWDKLVLVSVANANTMVTLSDLDFSKAMPDSRNYMTYPGSLTTPPCYEGVTWYVMTEPVMLSASQLTAYRNCLGFIDPASGSFAAEGNRRDIQLLNGRQLRAYVDAYYDPGQESTRQTSIAALVFGIFTVVLAVGVLILLGIRHCSIDGHVTRMKHVEEA